MRLLAKVAGTCMVWRMLIAPEGLAVGVGFGSGDIANGISLPVGIGLQNMPEGLAVALPLLREHISPGKAFMIALLTGLVEPVGGLLGVGLVQIAQLVLPLALAFAAGEMLFIGITGNKCPAYGLVGWALVYAY